MKTLTVPLLAIAIFSLIAGAPLCRGEVTLKVGDIEGPPSKEIQVPILISGSTKTGPMQFILDYDRRILEAVTDPPGAEQRGVVFGQLISGGMIATNTTEPGEVKIALRTDEPITQDGELVRVRFLVKGKRGDACTLNLLVPEAWEKESLFEVPVRVQPGKFHVGGFALPLPLSWILAIAAIIVLLPLLLVLRNRSAQGVGPVPVAASPSRATVNPPAPPTSGNIAPAGAGDDAMNLLRKLKEMQAAGLISQEDFEKKKKDLLDRL